MKPLVLLLSISIVLPLLAIDKEWIPNDVQKVCYMYAPGIFDNERQAAHYCTSYTASTGEEVVCGRHIETIQGASCIACNFAEILLSPSERRYGSPSAVGGTLMSRIITKGRSWFHNRVHDKKMAISVEGNSLNGMTVQHHEVHIPNVSLAQDQDIAILSELYDSVTRQEERAIILYGVSRGAETIFNFLSTLYLEKDVKNIKGAVFEGCFDSLEHVLNEYFFLKKMLFRFLVFRYFPTTLADRTEPIDLAHLFPQDIPVLFITSKKDEIVSYKCTQELCAALKKAGHQHTYLLELSHSGHNAYFYADALDAWKYERVVHAFYKRYGLDFVFEYASAGEALLDQCRL